MLIVPLYLYRLSTSQALFSLRPFTKDITSPFWTTLLQSQVEQELNRLENERQKALKLRQQQEEDSSWMDDDPPLSSAVAVSVIPPVSRETTVYEEVNTLLK